MEGVENPTFGDLSRRQQLRRVRKAAEAALEQFGLAGAELRLLNHEFNTTFRVTGSSGDRWALRINLNSAYAAETVRAEAEWVHLLGKERIVPVPRPQRTSSGDFVAEVSCEGLSGEQPAVLYSWLPGREIGERGTAAQYRALGASMAALHEYTAKPSAALADIAARRPVMTSTLLDDPDRITTGHPAIDDDTRDFLAAALRHVDGLAQPIYDGPTQLIHGDLHGYNVKWLDGEISIFDFDDSGVATMSQDLATAAFYVRDTPRLEHAMHEGYETVRPLPDHSPEQYEALVAGRNLLLLNFVVGSVTAGMDDFLPGYIERTVGRLRRYLDTGTFEL